MVDVVIKNLVKKYGDMTAVSHLDLVAKSGELTTLLGPSGCGKTTTLRCIAGLEKRPEEGEIYIGNQLVVSAERRIFVPPQRRDLSMVFQSYAIWPHMTVFDNIQYGLKYAQKLPKNEIKEKVTKTLRLLGLEGLEKRSATDLSGGQQQRVALARSLVLEREVLLLDEPLSNLDAKLRERMRIDLRELQRRLDITVLYVTHDQGEAMVLSDKICVMNAGKKVAEGSPLEIYHKPASEWVANFIGKINLLKASVKNGESGIIETKHGLLIKCNIPSGLKGKSNVVAGIRPEFITLHDKPLRETENVFEGRVDIVVNFGNLVEYEVSVADATFHVQSTDSFKEGQPIYLRIPVEKVILLEQ